MIRLCIVIVHDIAHALGSHVAPACVHFLRNGFFSDIRILLRLSRFERINKRNSASARMLGNLAGQHVSFAVPNFGCRHI